MKRIKMLKMITLISTALFCILRGLAYFPLPFIKEPDVLPKGLELISEIVPIGLWGLIWTALGLYCIWCAIRNEFQKPWAFFAGLSIGWGVAYLYGWIEVIVVTGEITRSWVAASNYITVGVLIGALSLLSGLSAGVEKEGNYDG